MFGFIRKNRIKRAFRKNKRKHAFRNIETINNVLILFQPKDISEILLLADDFIKRGKKVILWTVDDHCLATHQNTHISIKILKKEKISNIHILRSEVIKEFENLEYDTLIDFTSEIDQKTEPLTYLLAINKAVFCIGCHENIPKGVYDLIVLRKKDQPILELFNEMKLFLQKIKS